MTKKVIGDSAILVVAFLIPLKSGWAMSFLLFDFGSLAGVLLCFDSGGGMEGTCGVSGTLSTVDVEMSRCCSWSKLKLFIIQNSESWHCQCSMVHVHRSQVKFGHVLGKEPFVLEIAIVRPCTGSQFHLQYKWLLNESLNACFTGMEHAAVTEKQYLFILHVWVFGLVADFRLFSFFLHLNRYQWQPRKLVIKSQKESIYRNKGRLSEAEMSPLTRQ